MYLILLNDYTNNVYVCVCVCEALYDTQTVINLLKRHVNDCQLNIMLLTFIVSPF